jgi:hypothetical protein
MNPSHSHWLRRIWEAYQRVPREGVTPSRRMPRRTTVPDPARPAVAEPGQRDDFEETKPLVFPLH